MNINTCVCAVYYKEAYIRVLWISWKDEASTGVSHYNTLAI